MDYKEVKLNLFSINRTADTTKYVYHKPEYVNISAVLTERNIVT